MKKSSDYRSRDCRIDCCLLSIEKFYLSGDHFDHGIGQATKAAGIISPWFSKRRNKAWYRMARLGSRFLSGFDS